MMKGSCFCKQIKFEVHGITPILYQCHCSMCRKVTSSTSNTAFIIPKKNFRWLENEGNISSFEKSTGYRVDFCIVCGSTVPNEYQNTMYWVPAGLLDDTSGLTISNHLCVSSKASWDTILDAGEQHQGVPAINSIISG